MPDSSHDKFADFGDVSCAACILDLETIWLHPEDVISLKLWVERFREENVQVFYKDKIGQSPPDLPVHKDHLIVCFQTQFQVDVFWCLGSRFIGIDATHNTTIYPRYDVIYNHHVGRMGAWCISSLCSVPGHWVLTNFIYPFLATGVLVAWMISSSMRKDTIAFFLNWVNDESPDI